MASNQSQQPSIEKIITEFTQQPNVQYRYLLFIVFHKYTNNNQLIKEKPIIQSQFESDQKKNEINKLYQDLINITAKNEQNITGSNQSRQSNDKLSGIIKLSMHQQKFEQQPNVQYLLLIVFDR